jgi:hypothetical protein
MAAGVAIQRNSYLPFNTEHTEAVGAMEMPARLIWPFSPTDFSVPPLHWNSPSPSGWPLHSQTTEVLSPSWSVTGQSPCTFVAAVGVGHATVVPGDGQLTPRTPA